MYEARLTIKTVASLAQIEDIVIEGIRTIRFDQRAIVLGTIAITQDSRFPEGAEYQRTAEPRGFHIVYYPWKVGDTWFNIVLLSRDVELAEAAKRKTVNDFLAGLQQAAGTI